MVCTVMQADILDAPFVHSLLHGQRIKLEGNARSIMGSFHRLVTSESVCGWAQTCQFLYQPSIFALQESVRVEKHH